MQFLCSVRNNFKKHNWAKAGLAEYDYVAMRQQGENGKLTNICKTIIKLAKNYK